MRIQTTYVKRDHQEFLIYDGEELLYRNLVPRRRVDLATVLRDAAEKLDPPVPVEEVSSEAL